jgi:hypothetical protein
MKCLTAIANLERADGQAEHHQHRFSPALVLVAFMVVQLLAAGTAAQTTTSTIEGFVTDSKGAVIAGAQITAKSASLGIERTSTSDGEGFYRITALPAGVYTLSVSSKGFADRNFETLELTVNRTLTLNPQMEVGAVQSQVNVTAESQLIDSTSSASGATVTPRQIQDLPVNGKLS